MENQEFNGSYKNVNYGKKSVRRNYSKVRTAVDLPGLIDIQTKSFDQFVDSGLQEVFNDVSPITSFNGELKIYFVDYHFEDPKFSVVESKLRKINFSRPLKATVTLENTKTGVRVSKEVFMGDVPYMTPVGTFVINGAERVVISQIVRSSGVYYTKEIDKKTGETKFGGTVMPTRGSWIEYETSSRGDVWYGKLNRSKKIPLTEVLRAFGLSSNKDIIDLFGNDIHFEETFKKDNTTNSDDAVIDIYAKLHMGEKATVEGARELIYESLFNPAKYDLQKVGRFKYNQKLDVLSRAKGYALSRDVIAACDVEDAETGEILYSAGEVIAKAGEIVEGEVYDRLNKARAGYSVEINIGHDILDKHSDKLCKEGEELKTICEVLYVNVVHGDSTEEVKIIGNKNSEDALWLTMSDVVASVSYFINLYSGVGRIDDIDHLGNRRLRLIGELLKNQFRIGFSRLRKNIEDRMSTIEPEKATPQNLINIKPLTSSLKEFFGSSQLSQFMDQINPLAEITQKRRISALGTGGIARDRAGVEVRDVHNSHYGRMCPIETPEGPSIGLITSLASYAKIDEYGFIQTPYFPVKVDANGVKYVSNDVNEICYLTATTEEGKIIAAANTKLDAEGHIIEDKVIGRLNGETEIFNKEDIEYILRGHDDVEVVMHLPHGMENDLISQDNIMLRYFNAIDYAGYFNVKKFTLHLGSKLKEDYLERCIKNVEKLCDYASHYDACIMIENMPADNEIGSNLEELEYIFKTVNKKNLKFIYDTGHGHVALKDTDKEIEMIKKMRPYLAHMHINDNDSTKDMHARIGSGNVDFKKIFSELDDYEGLYCLEILFNDYKDLKEYREDILKMFQ